jgi:uncharacterized oligopeptide transporter (OPT) family protein
MAPQSEAQAPQLTVRAVVTGMLLGAVMCLSNLYVVLKTGWSIGVTLTACIMAWGLFTAAKAARLASRDMGILENNAMGSVASAAGYMTGGGNMAALPALMMLTGARPEVWVLVLWFAGIAALGVFAAIPIKRQLINQEQLPFPTGTATAQTLKALYGEGTTGKAQAKRLALAGAFGGLIAWLRDAKLGLLSWNLPATFAPPVSWRGKPLLEWTVGFEGSVLMFGAGALMSWRTGKSLLLGALVMFGFLAPELFERGIVTATGFKPIAGWSVWLGASILVASGLVSFAFQWKSVKSSLDGLLALLRAKREAVDPLEASEAPASWFPLGFVVLGPVVAVLGWYAFDIPIWAGLLALPLSVLMGTVAARVTGETDVTPTKALGPVTQLLFAALLPNQLVPNLMSANITGGVGLHAADLLTDLKSGFLLGAKPRQQVIGQFFGVIAGALVVVPAFYLLVPDAQTLGGEEFPAPSAMVWANVSKMLVSGLSALHPTAQVAAVIGALVGSVLAVFEAVLPKKHLTWVPSPSGLGIAIVIPAYNSIMMFLGAGVAEWWRRRRGAEAESDTMPIASGFIAGESLVGIAVKMLVAFGLMAK